MRSGVTMLELLVVVAILAVIAAFGLPSGQEAVPLNKLSAKAKSVAQRLTQLSIDARTSGNTVRITCSANSITASYFSKNRTYDYASSVAAISGATSLSDSVILDQEEGIQIQTCASTQTYYVSSEGYFFQNSGNTPGLDLTMNLSSFSARVLMSGASYPRVFLGPTGNPSNEL